MNKTTGKQKNRKIVELKKRTEEQRNINTEGHNKK